MYNLTVYVGLMVPLNLTYPHCLQHSLFEHVSNLYNKYKVLLTTFVPALLKYECEIVEFNT